MSNDCVFEFMGLVMTINVCDIDVTISWDETRRDEILKVMKGQHKVIK